MIKVSELLSKRMIALGTAEVAGTISNIIFDPKLTCGKYLKIYNDDGTDIEVRYVELKKVKKLDYDACVISDISQAVPEWTAKINGAVSPMNCECFNQDGKFLGIVRDVYLNELSVSKILIGEKEFMPDTILSNSDKLLIINDTGKPIKLVRPKLTMPKVSSPQQTVSLHSVASVKSGISSQAAPPAKPQSAPPHADKAFASAQNTDAQPTANMNARVKPQAVPQKLMSEAVATELQKAAGEIQTPSKVPPSGKVISTPSNDPQPSPYKFLLGKTNSRNIIADSGELIVTEGTLITDSVINCVRKHGKLVQLALHAE